jgi:predicted ATP-binding protein involved in virulence
MYLQEVTIRNIKCFEEIKLDFRNADGSIRLWNVIIGENGTGKTSLLQAIAIALLGQKAASVLLPRPSGWVRAGAQKGEIEAIILPGMGDAEAGKGEALESERPGKPIQARYAIVEQSQDADDPSYEGPTIVESAGSHRSRLRQMQSQRALSWFAAGYGPFRRLGGGSELAQDITQLDTRESRFVTLFRADTALTECTQWLMEIDYARLDSSNPEQRKSELLLASVREALDSHLLPEGVRLETINSQGVYFRTPYAEKVSISDLSDGYKAMLSLAIDLLRHLSQSHRSLYLSMDSTNWLRHATGVVVIDELDAHLHPTWQREVSSWFKDRFPNIQFIVATHSPFIPQAADDCGLYVLRHSPKEHAVQIEQEQTSVRGWRADQILSILFDTPSMYDPETEAKLREHARLRVLVDMDQLPLDQRERLAELEAWVEQHQAPPGNSQAEIEDYRDLQRRILALSRIFKEQTGQ